MTQQQLGALVDSLRTLAAELRSARKQAQQQEIRLMAELTETRADLQALEHRLKEVEDRFQVGKGILLTIVTLGGSVGIAFALAEKFVRGWFGR